MEEKLKEALEYFGKRKLDELYCEALVFLERLGWSIQTTLVGKKIKMVLYKGDEPFLVEGQQKIDWLDFTQDFPKEVVKKHIILYKYFKQKEDGRS